jgi:acetyl-CoA acetyltransferase
VDLPEGSLAADEGVKADLTPDQLRTRKPAFRRGGSVTAGNSPPSNDGAAVVLLMSEGAVARVGLNPLARYVGSGAAGRGTLAARLCVVRFIDLCFRYRICAVRYLDLTSPVTKMI